MDTTSGGPEVSKGPQNHKLEVSLDRLGSGKVVVDGKDVSSFISGIMVVAKVGEPTIVTLTLIPGIDVELEDEGVKVFWRDAGDPGESQAKRIHRSKK